MRILPALLLPILMACTTPQAAPPATAAEPPIADLPAAALVPPPLPPPGNARNPGGGWRAVTRAREGGIAGAWVHDASVARRDDRRLAWALLNLKDSIPIPETGGRARSARILGEFDCDDRAWRRITSIWYALPNAREEVFTDPARRSVFEVVTPGSATAVFLDAVCAG